MKFLFCTSAEARIVEVDVDSTSKQFAVFARDAAPGDFLVTKKPDPGGPTGRGYDPNCYYIMLGKEWSPSGRLRQR